MTTTSTKNNTPSNVKVCTKTVMDSIADPKITFDENGVCNYFYQYQDRVNKFFVGGEEGKRQLDDVFNKIKEEGKGKKYDCITGVSGGVDSTYMIYLCKQYGLRPLVIHLDNGWNSEIANQNINNIIDKCGYDLYTHVIDWDEFKDLQLSFLKASVIDLELTSDHAIFAIIYKLAKKHNIKHLLSGFNITTEGILPEAWRWYKYDWLNISSIQKQFGSKKLKSYPHVSFNRKIYFDLIKKMQTVMPLNYLDYNKEEAKKVITEELGWRDYGGKHFESIITRFYQGYILPEKFGVDKRKAHLSTLIASGQMTREEALEELKQPIYDAKMLAEDKEFVLKKFSFSEAEFDAVMQAEIKSHDAYPSYITNHYKRHEQIMKAISPATRLVKKVLGIKRESKTY
ncbi:MAG: N-acetyl sugar amidotransferase [Flavobacteriales bacterium]|nr:N-acetyl sugar amidotransferase [Flavobacteriales bacterium]